MIDAAQVFFDRSAQLTARLPDIPRLPDARGRVVVAGIGGSEGPARIHALALRARGVQASFVPLSGVPRAEGDELRIFSQNLSPNARIALAATTHFARSVLVTSEPEVKDFAGTIVRFPMEREDGLLVRIIGPTIATRIALQAGASAEVVRAAWARGQIALDRSALAGPVAFLVSGDDGERYFGQRWKWLETLGTCDPPIYDVLNFAHGPFQLWYDQPLTLIGLRTKTDRHDEAWGALAELVRPKQRLVFLDAETAQPEAWFEHDVMVNALLCDALRLGVGHGQHWRGFGEDRPMYDLCSLAVTKAP